MLAYHWIKESKEKRKLGGAAESKDDKHEMLAYLVEKIIKRYNKSHRGATDFDSAYIEAIVNDIKGGVSCSIT